MTPRSLAVPFVLAGLVLAAGAALAQPAPPPPSEDKLDATALMQSGVRLFEAKDYLGALAIFKDAYARFPSAKILLNIGTTSKLLDRNADAANAYQGYLDAPDADPAKKPDVAAVIAELDKTVGYLEISVTPAEAKVQINDEDWTAAATVARYRVPPGQFTVNARLDKFQPEAKSAQIIAGEKAAVSITLVALPEETRIPVLEPIEHGGGGGLAAGLEPEAHVPSRIGAYVMGHFDLHPDHLGGAALIGMTGHITSALQVRAAAIVGPTFGGFAGASFAFLPGTFRPFVAAGMPIFVSDGARVGFRGAGGLEVQITRNVALIGELGIEYPLSYEKPKEHTLFIPAIGASGRL